MTPPRVDPLAGLSPAQALAARLAELGPFAHAALDAILDRFSVVELVALAVDWRGFWARPKQIAPEGSWDSWGFLTGRGFGKTKSISQFVNAEVEAGRAMSICLAAQDEDNTVKLLVEGPSGLIATAPPWNKPEWHVSDLELVWPNGAKAYVRTPEVPGKIRGFEYHLSWICELQSWPPATRDEAYMNVLLSTRLGAARIVWDATPKRRHPLLKKLLEKASTSPDRNIVVRGTTRENAGNLGAGYVDKLESAIGGTQQGREELEGLMLDDAEGATVKESWIVRRALPEALARVAIGVDAAVTKRTGNDATGIVVDGLGPDGRVNVLEDLSGRHTPDAWAAIVLDAYARWSADCVVVETNKGGDLVTQNLRIVARARGLEVVVLGKAERPRHVPGVLYVREVYARGEKADRAKPLGTAYERGYVVHASGADLAELEEVLTTWVPEPGARSPDRLDAHVHAAVELLGLTDSLPPDPKIGFQGIERLGAALAAPTAPSSVSAPARALVAALGGGGGGRI